MLEKDVACIEYGQRIAVDALQAMASAFPNEAVAVVLTFVHPDARMTRISSSQ
jgi:hypothetical protein